MGGEVGELEKDHSFDAHKKPSDFEKFSNISKWKTTIEDWCRYVELLTEQLQKRVGTSKEFKLLIKNLAMLDIKLSMKHILKYLQDNRITLPANLSKRELASYVVTIKAAGFGHLGQSFSLLQT